MKEIEDERDYESLAAEHEEVFRESPEDLWKDQEEFWTWENHIPDGKGWAPSEEGK